jgi:hypothetical protein
MSDIPRLHPTASSAPVLPPDLAAACDDATELVRQSTVFTFVVNGTPQRSAGLARACLVALDQIHERATREIWDLQVQLAATRSNTVRFGELAAATAHEVALMLFQDVDQRVRLAVLRGGVGVCADPKDWGEVVSGRAGLDLNSLFSPDRFDLWAQHFHFELLADTAAVLALQAELQLEARRAATLRQQRLQTARRKTGRPRRTETDKERLVVAALAKHHGYQPGGIVERYTPATTARLAKLASGKGVKVSASTVSRFLKRKFPNHDHGYAGYRAACNLEARTHIGLLLALWQGEASERLAGLLPHESGREEDDE